MLTPALYLAWRNLRQNPVATFFLVGAVAAGVGFQIPNTANLDGYRAELIKHSITAGFGHVRVRPASGGHIIESAALAARLHDIPRVRDVAVVLTFPGAIGRAGEQAESGHMRGAAIFGVDMTRAHQPFTLRSGSLVAPGDERGVIVGATLAARFELQVGDEVRVHAIFDTGDDSLADGDDSLADDDEEGADGIYTMTVRGLAVGTYSAARSVFLDYRFVARESGLLDSSSMILVYLDGDDATERVAAAVAGLGADVLATTWLEDDTFIRSAIQSSRAIGGISESMVVFAVAIPVLALMYIQVVQRRRDIGLLAAIGFSPVAVFSIFLAQALVIGALGIAIGCALGYGLVSYFQANVLFEWENFVIRPLLSWQGIARPTIVVLTVTLVAAVYPAWRAARMAPARVLRELE